MSILRGRIFFLIFTPGIIARAMYPATCNPEFDHLGRYYLLLQSVPTRHRNPIPRCKINRLQIRPYAPGAFHSHEREEKKKSEAPNPQVTMRICKILEYFCVACSSVRGPVLHARTGGCMYNRRPIEECQRLSTELLKIHNHQMAEFVEK